MVRFPRTGTLRILALATNAVASLAFLVGAAMAWGRAGDALASVGGFPTFDAATLKALAMSPDLPQRLFGYGSWWVFLVAAIGMAVLAVAGIRHVALSAIAILPDRTTR